MRHNNTRHGFNHPYTSDLARRGRARHDATQKDKTRSLFQPYTYDQTRRDLIWLDRTRQDTPFNQHMVVTRWLVAAGSHPARPRTGVTNGGGQAFTRLGPLRNGPCPHQYSDEAGGGYFFPRSWSAR